MRRVLSFACVFGVALVMSHVLGDAQAPAANVFPAAAAAPPNLLELKNFLPTEPPANLKPSAPLDLSGTWYATPYQSISVADRPGRERGKEKDIAYQPWALQRMMSEFTPTGPDAQPDKTTDPFIRFCEPNGPLRVYAHPGRTQFVIQPDRVVLLHELMQTFRVVRLNSKHPPLDEIDPSVWGDSIGWFENGNRFVIDTIGVNGRAWLDQMGHPMSEKAHIIERYERTDASTLSVTRIIDDPGSYLRPIEHTLNLKTSDVPFLRSVWNCSVRDNSNFTEKLLNDAATPSK